LLSKQRHRHASLLIGDGVVENRDRSTTPLNYRLRCFEPDLALFPQQQMFNGGPDKSGSGRKPRAKDAGNPMVDMLINTETDDTILDHWPSVLPWIVNAASCCDFILFSNTGIFGWGQMQYTALGSDRG
jgi:hypothetical protein